MRILLYIVILAVAFSLPVKRLDIAKLEPVEAVAIYEENGRILLKTDQGSTGWGMTVQEALQNLKDTASSIIYLDTADYLLVGENCERAAQQLRKYLRENIQTGLYRGTDVQEEARFLDVHNNRSKPAG